jgi:hypothetical protein
MTKKKQRVNFVRGDDHELEFTITDADEAVKSLTGATSVKWEVFDGSTAVLQKSLVSGVALFNINGTDDGVRVTIAAADTASLDTGNYQHELECVLGGKRITLAQGWLVLDEEHIVNA